MKVVFVWIAILSVVSVTALSFPYNECGGSEIICKNLQIDLDGQPTKGNAIGMSWKLECGQHEFINNLHIYVAFNGFSFHEEDTPQNVEVSGGAQAEVKYSVTIPSFAPSVQRFFSLLDFNFLFALGSLSS